jgi:hypothetical protein
MSFKKIGESNNSRVFEIFGYQVGEYPRKEFPLNRVMKSVSHKCASDNSNSQLKIHRKECRHL